MPNPLQVRALALMAGALPVSKDFMIGWANGLVRWSQRDAVSWNPPDDVEASGFPKGSIKFAASEAAVTYMRSLEP